MEHSKLFTNSLGQDYCSVQYIPTRQMVTVTWSGGVTRESVMKVREWLLTLFRESHCPLMLNDMQELMVVSTEEFALWLKEEWDTAAAALGLRCIADVVGEDTIAEVYSQEIGKVNEEESNPLAIKTFHSRFDALDWLIEKRARLES